MPDQSSLDERYFIDEWVYNCPFCNRRHVSYGVYERVIFDWTDTKSCYCYFVRCFSCGQRSMHLTFQMISTHEFRPTSSSDTYWRFEVGKDEDAAEILARAFFYSVPTSFFVLDARVPHVLRELLTEAEVPQEQFPNGCVRVRSKDHL